MSSAAPPPPASVTLTSQTPNLNLTEANGTGAWYAQSVLDPAAGTILTLTADNSVAIPASSPTTANVPLTDLVVITQAQFRLSTGELTLVASTSDETTPPVLTAHTGNGALIGNLSGTGAVKTLSTSLSPIPPAKVQVTSTNGGSDTEDVVLVP